jgi:tRNA (Thr-GGU) A37 N-methylase
VVGECQGLYPGPAKARRRIDRKAHSYADYIFTIQPIGYVKSPYKDAQEIPKGLSAKHETDGVLEILPEFAVELTDIEGFSHLMVIWVFHRSQGFELLAIPPSDDRPHGAGAVEV